MRKPILQPCSHGGFDTKLSDMSDMSDIPVRT
jgi:hypothetical protein